MERKRLLLIVNPISGTASKTELIPKIEQKLRDIGYEVDTRFTEGQGDATRMAGEAVAQGYDTVAVCGGDGTVNEAARALCGTGMPMAILPSGSGNGLARHIGLAPHELAAVDIIKEENLTDCDYGLVNEEKFFCAFGLGFDAAVAEKFAEASTRGISTYVKKAFEEFTSYQPKSYRITIDGTTTLERKAFVIACCNASQYGNNAFIAPYASITDGLLDVIILNDASHIQLLIMGLDMLTGMLPHNRQIEIIRARRVDIESLETSAAHIDGEPIGEKDEYHIEVVPGKLKLYTHIDNRKFTPFITPLDYMTRDITAAISKLFE